MQKADLIFKNVNIITMEAAQPIAQMVATAGEKVVFVGSDSDTESVCGPATTIIDCNNRTLVPGFNDAHCHIFSLVRTLLSMDLSPESVKSIADIRTLILRQSRQTPPGQWLSGTGYNEFYLAEKRHPTRWDIDEVSPQHPVMLTHRSLHACVLNSFALRLAGITRETPEPPGAFFERDMETGELTGVLFEMVGYLREKVLPLLTEEEVIRSVALANDRFLANGITSLQDATIVNDLARWQTFRLLKDTDVLQSRLSMMIGADAIGKFRQAGLTTGSGDNLLRLGGVKIILSEATGSLHPALSELKEQVLKAHRAGFQLAIHALEPDTVEAAISALEYVQHKLPGGKRRHRIEHCSECPPPLLERLKKLNAVVVTQLVFLYYGGERYLATIPAERLAWLYRFKSLLDSGLVVAASSDSPVVPLNPLVGICSAVTRRAASGQRVLPQESISVLQALRMYTLDAAYASFEEETKGSITPGKLADMVLLSADPATVAPEQIKDIKVEMAVVGGKIVWRTF